MPRKLRIEYLGAIYHVMDRGNRREDVFHDDLDRQCFLQTLTECCAKTRFQIHAYCLMRNHFHLVVETPEGNLVNGMRWLISTYSNRFNHRHQLVGHLFSARYKALVVDGSGTGYLRTVCDYTHLNPFRAKILAPEQTLAEYPWSSYRWYLAGANGRPAWLRVDRLLGEHGLEDTETGRQRFAERMETRRQGEVEGMVQRGWCIGGQGFKERLLLRLGNQLREHHAGEIRMEATLAKAEAIVGETLKKWGWTEEDLGKHSKGDTHKMELATRLRGETTVPIRWIAERLRMGSWKSLSSRLHKWQQLYKGGNTMV